MPSGSPTGVVPQREHGVDETALPGAYQMSLPPAELVLFRIRHQLPSGASTT